MPTEDFSAALGLGAGVLVVLGIVLLFLYAYIIVLYIFQAIGISKMMKSLKLNNSWMAYVPIFNTYAFGKVAEQYIKKDGRKSAKFSVILLVCQFVILFLSIILSIVSFSVSFAAASGETEMTMVMSIVIMLFSLFVMACSYAVMAVQYVALWRIFAIFAPKNATLYTVLSIFLAISSFLIFASRNAKPVSVEIENGIPEVIE